MVRLLVSLSLLATVASAAVLSGYTRDASSGEPLAFVNVYLTDGSVGTVSDRTGYYLLGNVPAGRLQVSFSMVGYQTLDTTLVFNADKPLRFDARLQPEPIPVGEVTVSAQRQRFNREIDLGVRRLDVRDLQIAPGFIEQDLFKSLQLLPGVVSISDLASALYVRGGSPDQNAVLLDGVPIYNPYHLGGLFSTFNLDAVSAAELNSGAFPAQYGGGVSSVLDVEMREGNTERYAGRWDLGILTTKAVLEGPLPKGSFLVAGRRTYIDAVTWTLGRLFRHPEYHLPYYFYDLQTKANFDISNRDRLTLSGFIGDDIINIADSLDRVNFRWGNYTLAAKHRHIFSPRLLLTSLLTNGRNRVGLDAESRYGGETSRVKLNMSINDIGLRQDITWFPESSHTLRAGWEGKSISLRNQFITDTLRLWDMSDRPWSASAYASDNWRIIPPLLLNLGFRAEYFTSGRHFRLSPRLGAKFFLQEDLALTAGYGHYYQFLSIPFPVDEIEAKVPAFLFQQWIPADDKLKPVQAIHYVLGAEKWFRSDIRLRAEAYYKNMANLLQTSSFLPDPFAPGGEADSIRFETGTGWATGAELLLNYRGSWLGYSLAWTRRRFGEADFYQVFDARHNVNFGWSFDLGRAWNISLQWVFRSGFPETGPVGQYQHVIEEPGQEPRFYWTPVYGRRGNFRLPPYHRLDAGINKSFHIGRLPCSFYLQVVNVYARKNALWYNYYQDENGRLVREATTFLPIPIPSIGIRGEF